MALSGGLLLPISSIIILISLAYKLYQRLRFKLPPGPRAWPIVGNLYDIKPVRFRCYAEWAQEYGPIMSVWTGTTLNVVVSSSELAKEVLKEHDQKLADRHRSKSAAKFSKDGQDLIWADYGPHYVKVRKMIAYLECFVSESRPDDGVPSLSKALGLQGTVADFEGEAGRDFGGMKSFQPLDFIRPAGADDVARVLKAAARSSNLTVAARVNDHSINGQAMADRDLVLDMRSLGEHLRVVRASDGSVYADMSGGALWEDVLKWCALEYRI